MHKGLCDYGYVDESFELFRRRFDMMLDESTNQTLWEEWWLDGSGRTGKFMGGRTRSDAQTESAFPPALFAEYLLGFAVTKPGMKEVEISCPDTEIKNLQSKVPTPNGLLTVVWNFNDKIGGELELMVPAKMNVKLMTDSFKERTKKGILVNGKKIELSNSKLVLKEGKHKIQF